MSQTTAIEALKEVLTQVPLSQRGFAESLLNQFDSKGNLSSKQWYWVKKLAEDATAPKEEPVSVKVGGLEALLALFSKAAEKLKYPAIVLRLEDGQDVAISRAAPYSNNPNHVYVKLPETLGYAGKVSSDGSFYPLDKVNPEMQTALATILGQLAANPAEVAAAYGKLTGRCCFCGRELSDEKSTAVGYGKTCAKNYGLPYGGTALLDKVVLETTAAAAEQLVAPVAAPVQEAIQLPLDLDALIAVSRKS